MPALNFSKKRGRKFTVVELLVVVSIMGMILGIALPSFTKLMFGGGVTAGASAVASQLRFCRSYALSKRQYVALIIPDEESLAKDNPNIYRSFRAARVRKPRGGSSGSWEFIGWLDDSAWTFLTSGVYLDFGSEDSDNNTDPIAIMKVDLESLSGSRQGDALAIVITPTGKPVGSVGKDVAVTVGEGFWDEDTDSLNVQTSSKKNKLMIDVDSNTGRVEVIEPTMD